MRVTIGSLTALLFVTTAGRLAPQSARPTPFQEQKAVATLRTQLPCLGCHALNGEGARSAPSLTDVGKRRSAAYIRAMVDDPQRVVPGAGMPRTPMPPATRDLVVNYLSRDAATGPPPPAPTTHVVDRTPQALYTRWCAQCHGHQGSGDGPNAQFLPVRPAVHQDTVRMGSRSDDQLFDVIAAGGLLYGMSPRMPAFGATLSNAEIRQLVGHIRGLCQCSGPAWARR